MKKIFYTLLAGVMALASCSKETTEELATQSGPTTFTLSVGEIQTRAISTVTPARYVMEVWSEEGSTAENVFGDGTTNRIEVTSGSISVVLDKTKAYTCLFWADDDDTYNASSLKAVALNTGKEYTEAYYAKVDVAAGRNLAIDVMLKRAVAKITLNEIAEMNTSDNIALSFSGISPLFNVFTGTAEGTPAEWTKSINPAATTGVLHTQYFFAATTESLTEFKFTTNIEPQKTVSNVPYRQNYATAIKGEYSGLFNGTFSVTVDDEWETLNIDHWDGTTPDFISIDGNGTENSPFRIETAAQLAYLSKLVNSGVPSIYTDKGIYYKLMNHIDLGSYPWTPIGNDDASTGSSRSFSGAFDGNGFTIYNLNVENYDYCAGLFSGIGTPAESKYSVINLNIVGAKVSGKQSIGILVGKITNSGNNFSTVIIKNCNVTGSLSFTGTDNEGYYGLGGIVGDANYLFLSQCSADVVITDSHNAGGMVGMAFKCTISDCNAKGTISGSWNIGGFAGFLNANTSVTSCTTMANVSANDWHCGGFVGYVNSENEDTREVIITSCTASGNVTSTVSAFQNKVGGFVGELKLGICDRCTFNGSMNITDISTAGAFLGFDNNGTTKSCKYDGSKVSFNPVGDVGTAGTHDITTL